MIMTDATTGLTLKYIGQKSAGTVIPGRELRSRTRNPDGYAVLCFWIPGSRFQRAPE